MSLKPNPPMYENQESVYVDRLKGGQGIISGGNSRTMKHTLLYEAIGHLDTVTNNLHTLLNEITTNTEVASDSRGGDRPAIIPSLHTMLTDAPDHIIRKCEEAHKVIETIRDVLF